MKKIENEDIYFMSQREIANRLNISKQAVQVTEKRALRKFKMNFEVLFSISDFEFLEQENYNNDTKSK